MIQSHGASDTGCVRQNNEDRILIVEDFGLFIVADGMGGRSHGEQAAEVAVATILHYIESTRDRLDVTWPFGYDFSISFEANRLVTGIQLANGQVWKYSEQAPEYAGMGTTIAAILAIDNTVTVANVGDSRGYLFRGGKLKQLTIDDTWINAVALRGAEDISLMQKHPMRNFLTQAAGSKDHLDVHTSEMEMEAGDLILLSSDGLHGVLDEKAIISILERSPRHLASLCQRLVGAAKGAGGPDNISCILLAPAD